MDLSTLIIVIIVFILLFSMCGWCCKRKSDVITFTTVTVPHANPNVPGAYPPQNIGNRTVTVSGVNQPMPYTPYPMPQTVHPPPIGFQGVSYPVNNPYPTTTTVNQQQQPPSYDDAVASAPYNPNFK